MAGELPGHRAHGQMAQSDQVGHAPQDQEDDSTGIATLRYPPFKETASVKYQTPDKIQLSLPRASHGDWTTRPEQLLGPSVPSASEKP